MKYATAKEWCEAAMKRDNSVAEVVIKQRRVLAQVHYAKESVQPTTDILADHELYILGKMEIEEYEQYLLLKHSQNAPE